MIPQVLKINVPSNVIFTQVVENSEDMGDKTLTIEVDIDGGITPDFSEDWEIEYLGERYIMPLRTPQGSKDNTILSGKYSLIFQHKGIYELKRYLFCTFPPEDSSTAIPDKYESSISLPLNEFRNLLAQICDYYYGEGTYTIDLNKAFEIDPEPTTLEINHSYIWDVVIKLYEYFQVRWEIVSTDIDKWAIRIGYEGDAIEDHIFEYLHGGLSKIERQVQDEDIRNELLGRGGSKNLPFRYYKKVDPENSTFHADPDWIPELENIYFTELRGATFRSYIQGWRAAHIEEYKKEYPNQTWELTIADYRLAYAPWAFLRGYTDAKFSPVEFVADRFLDSNTGHAIVPDSSIARYGELIGGLSNNEEIYPTIQGIIKDGLGRLDETVEIEQMSDDTGETKAENSPAFVTMLEYPRKSINAQPGHNEIKHDYLCYFSVPKGMYGDIVATPVIKVQSEAESDLLGITEIEVDFHIVNTATSLEVAASGIPEGNYQLCVTYKFNNTLKNTCPVTCAIENFQLIKSNPDGSNTKTFYVWIKNIWGSVKNDGESDTTYVNRVWSPILGTASGEETSVAFSDGALAVSEDYNFSIVKNGIVHDESMQIVSNDGNTYPSHWRLTLARSETDLESTGKLVPSTYRQGKAGDHFVFLGIDMPHLYTVEAEIRLDDWKKEEMDKTKDINPSWSVTLNKVWLSKSGMLKKLRPGLKIVLRDKRLIDGELPLYIKSVSVTYKASNDNKSSFIPDVELTLGDSYETTGTAVQTITSSIENLSRRIPSVAGLSEIVAAAGDSRYLRKDGKADTSYSPTSFHDKVSSGDFREGFIGGRGWGLYTDVDGNSVAEFDRLIARQSFEVNTLIKNQIEAYGGKSVRSAALMEVSFVEETTKGYRCYFDQKDGTVSNMFKVGDVGWCQRYNSTYDSIKEYKRKIVDVGEDWILLTKPIFSLFIDEGGNIDNGVKGNGIPESGDIIAHFGSYTDRSRRYAIVVDVIGGGNITFLQNLYGVRANGDEYIFLGRENAEGESVKALIGERDNEYIEWKDGKLTVKGDISIQSTIGNQTIDSYIESKSSSVSYELDTNVEYILRNPEGNLLPTYIHGLKYRRKGTTRVQTSMGFVWVRFSNTGTPQIVGEDDTEEFDFTIPSDAEFVEIGWNEDDEGAILVSRKNIPITSNPQELEFGVTNLVRNSKGTFSTPSGSNKNIVALSRCIIDRLEPGERYIIRAKSNGKFVNNPNNGIRQHGDVAIEIITKNGESVCVSDENTGNNSGTSFVWGTHTYNDKLTLRISSWGVSRTFSEIMLVKGNVIVSGWSPNPNDMDYIKSALGENTDISGGLVLTSRVETGYTDSDGVRRIMSGMNGIIGESENGKEIAFWAGGEANDAEVGLANPATYVVRHDGTGYMSGNTVKFLSDELRIGDKEEIRLTKEGLFLYEGDRVRMKVSDTPVSIPNDVLAKPYELINISDLIQVPTSSINPFFTLNSQTFSIGRWEGQRKLIMEFSAYFTFDAGVSVNNANCPRLNLEILMNTNGRVNTIATRTLTPKIQGQLLYYSSKFNLITSSAGIFSLRLSVLNQWSGSFESNKTGTLNIGLKGQASAVFEERNELGNNGMISTWGNSLIGINENGILLMSNGFALHISGNGVRKFDGNEWSQL